MSLTLVRPALGGPEPSAHSLVLGRFDEIFADPTIPETELQLDGVRWLGRWGVMQGFGPGLDDKMVVAARPAELNPQMVSWRMSICDSLGALMTYAYDSQGVTRLTEHDIVRPVVGHYVMALRALHMIHSEAVIPPQMTPHPDRVLKPLDVA